MLTLAERVLVVGMARSGTAAADALEARGVRVVRADRKLGNDDDLSLLDGVDLLVKSPGVPSENPLVVEARVRGIPVWSEVELGYRLLGEPALVGVTGTNGKTTTSELLGAIFRAARRDVVVAGNVGSPLTAARPADWIVCELSSFQLEDVHELRCRVAVLLNLEPDHLDRHGTFEAYRDAKLRIFERADTAVVPRGLSLPGREFAADDPLPAEPRIPGAHNRENDAAAVPYERSGDLATAVRAASAAAEPGEVVLLSPACASYDQFENFERRGEEFRRLVQNLS